MYGKQRTPHDILNDHGGLLVRRVVERNDEVTDALFEVAIDGRKNWTHREADGLQNSLKRCDMTVRDWLKSRENDNGND